MTAEDINLIHKIIQLDTQAKAKSPKNSPFASNKHSPYGSPKNRGPQERQARNANIDKLGTALRVDP